jgi:hypothetical protein
VRGRRDRPPRRRVEIDRHPSDAAAATGQPGNHRPGSGHRQLHDRVPGPAPPPCPNISIELLPRGLAGRVLHRIRLDPLCRAGPSVSTGERLLRKEVRFILGELICYIPACGFLSTPGCRKSVNTKVVRTFWTIFPLTIDGEPPRVPHRRGETVGRRVAHASGPSRSTADSGFVEAKGRGSGSLATVVVRGAAARRAVAVATEMGWWRPWCTRRRSWLRRNVSCSFPTAALRTE